MKCLKKVYPALVTLVVFGLMSLMVLASTPTVTVTKSSQTFDNKVVYNYTFTATTGLDTVVLYKSSASPFYIGYLGTKNVSDSLITLQLETSETSTDSVKMKALFQISYSDSPSTTATPSMASDDWMTFATFGDSNAVSFVNKFNPLRVGNPYKFRVVLIDTNPAKDAAQSMTARLCFPKFSSL